MSDLYETPPEIFEYWNRIFCFDLDVCAEDRTAKCKKYFTPSSDSLKHNWIDFGKRCWMNPPYSNVRPWLEKAREQQALGTLVVALLHADTSTSWYHEFIYQKPNVINFKPAGRIRFLLNGERAGSPKFGNIVAIFLPAFPGSKK